MIVDMIEATQDWDSGAYSLLGAPILYRDDGWKRAAFLHPRLACPFFKGGGPGNRVRNEHPSHFGTTRFWSPDVTQRIHVVVQMARAVP